MIPIVPAIIPKTAEEVRVVLPTLAFSPELHLDVVDGVFVPYVSWPYSPKGGPMEVKSVTDGFTLEVDLMTTNPLLVAEDWLLAGADMLVFHVETISPEAFVRFTELTSISVGICALNDTPLEDLEPYLKVADYAQVMGIAKIGSQGQPFDTRVLSRISQLKERYPKLMISVDGSVKAETIVSLKEAGANRFICGSAIVGAPSPEVAHAALSALIN